MSSKSEKDKQKQIQDKCQALLNGMLRDEDNKYCVDCDSKGPRWASWNLGVFLCIRCAGIHRNLGVHISKVKSVNLDSWTPEQVVSLQQMGNSRARAVYEANLPDNFRRPQTDSSLESFIRAKYEHKKYIAREWVPPQIPKVDWEKEIDEEIERQKRKKKAASDKKTAIRIPPVAEVPQLPKPKSSASPKPGRSTLQETPALKQTTDLLGLQNGDDGFSQFLSNSTVASTVETTVKKEEISTDSIQAEEKSFFNQPAPSEKEKIKMTKDSIMALYGTAPTQPIAYPNPIGQFQSNIAPNSFQQTYQFPQNFQQVQPNQNFQVQPNQNFPVQSFPNMPNGTQNVPNIPTNAPFINQNPQNIQQFGQNQFITSPFGQNTFGNSNLLPQNQFQSPLVGQNVPIANTANPFCGTMPLQQQFAGLNLTGSAVNNPVNNVGKPATANIWQ